MGTLILKTMKTFGLAILVTFVMMTRAKTATNKSAAADAAIKKMQDTV